MRIKKECRLLLLLLPPPPRSLPALMALALMSHTMSLALVPAGSGSAAAVSAARKCHGSYAGPTEWATATDAASRICGR